LSDHNAIPFVAALLSCIGIAGCGGTTEPAFGQQRGLKCVDDSNVCISQRKMVYDSYMADKSRAWVRQHAGPHEYASGVRLMAFSKMRKQLTCDELAHGKDEADRGPASLRSAAAHAGLTHAQVARGVMLANEVSRELAREISQRCR
jgi:hypothetical protein